MHQLLMLLIIDADNISEWFSDSKLHDSSEPTELIYDGKDIPWNTTKKFFQSFSYPSLVTLSLDNIGHSNAYCQLKCILGKLKLVSLRISDSYLKNLSGIQSQDQMIELTFDHISIHQKNTIICLPKSCQIFCMKNVKGCILRDHKKLRELHIFSSYLDMFFPSAFPNLRSFTWCYAKLKTLDLGNWPKLKHLKIVDTGLEDLTFPNFHPLEYIDLSCNRLKVLDISAIYDLRYINVHSNKLELITGTENNKRLIHLDCACNKIGNLIVDGLTELQTLKCYRNRLRDLNLANTNSLKDINHDDDIYVCLV
jgi:Leucine-rich repeat (LRR) protein